MMLPEPKHAGYALVVLAIVLLVLLVFVKLRVDAEESFLCESVHSIPGIDAEQCPAHTSNNSWLLFGCFGVSFLVLLVGVYLVVTPQVKPKPRKVDVTKLDGDEQKIYQALKAHEGSMYQSDLIKATGFSKVKVTRVLDKMAGRQLVDRQRRGMTNVIILK